MVCSSGVGFDPIVDNTLYTFDVASLYNGLFVMEDRQTGSVWTHFDGTVLTGPLAGTGAALKIEPLIHLRWADWVSEYPNSEVLDWIDQYASRYREYEPGGSGLGPQFLQTLLDTPDGRLPESELVLGVDADTASRAYVIEDLSTTTVINDDLGGSPIVVIMDPDALFGIAYEATVDGELRSFDWVGESLVDDTGASWSLDGSGDDGQLSFVTSFISEWYGWAAYHPDTSIYGL